MIYRDFGRMDGPVVLFGGPYSNFQALDALAARIDGRDAVCTGDVVGYCSEPNETAALFLELACPGIAGNCERQLLDEADTCACGFEGGSVCDVMSAGWWGYLRREMTPALVEQLNNAPDIGSFVHRKKRYAVIHGGGSATNRFLWPSTSEVELSEEIAMVEGAIGPVDGVVAGHCGIAFQRMIGRHHWVNAGAIGLPPHDGRPETRFGVLEGGEVIFHRLSYDHGTAASRMHAAGLTQGYHRALKTGIWPSEDILPEDLRR